MRVPAARRADAAGATANRQMRLTRCGAGLSDFADEREHIRGALDRLRRDLGNCLWRACSMCGLPSTVPRALAAASASVVRLLISVRSFCANAHDNLDLLLVY